MDREIAAGYKQTELGIIPEDWVCESLEVMSAFITKGSTPTTYGYKWEQSGVLFLRSECVSENGLDLTQSMFISPTAHATLRRSEVCDEDILITITGNVGRVVYLLGVGCANLNQHIARVRIISTKINRRYIYHFLSQVSIRKYFNTITTGQAYPQISLKQVRETVVSLPPTKTEQTAIANALSDVDALISGLDNTLAKKRLIKQGAMQELLTGKKRLAGFEKKDGYRETEMGNIPKDWEIKSLNEVTNITRLAGYEYSTVWEESSTGEIIALRGFNIGQNKIIERDLVRITNKLSMKLIRSRLFKGDVVYPCVGTIGNSVVIEEDDKYHIQQNIAKITPINSILNSYFLTYYLMSNFGLREIEKFNGSSSQPNILVGSLRKYSIILPSLFEQIAIAQILNDIDSEIEALEKRRTKTLAIKQGMMQELLTGKIRLI